MDLVNTPAPAADTENPRLIIPFMEGAPPMQDNGKTTTAAGPLVQAVITQIRNRRTRDRTLMGGETHDRTPDTAEQEQTDK
ncbi:hypothetical protein BW14_05985 [Bifidobacterium sp. UTBIF-68]|uniref:hypothetical protein n=1 Tax=Bifidobacterium sp. UTBIF-68 TaxID=1465262 RepID=UPI00112DB80A|nr:hypothetical protein [Bifidobacterium sp. UTBIF-68]TPF93223.1 hypothetical protein BW14_05985 [Bifidobacterium sp. UTBIF-68]